MGVCEAKAATPRCGNGILSKDAKSVDEFADYCDNADSEKSARVFVYSPDIPFCCLALKGVRTTRVLLTLGIARRP